MKKIGDKALKRMKSLAETFCRFVARRRKPEDLRPHDMALAAAVGAAVSGLMIGAIGLATHERTWTPNAAVSLLATAVTILALNVVIDRRAAEDKERREREEQEQAEERARLDEAARQERLRRRTGPLHLAVRYRSARLIVDCDQLFMTMLACYPYGEPPDSHDRSNLDAVADNLANRVPRYWTQLAFMAWLEAVRMGLEPTPDEESARRLLAERTGAVIAEADRLIVRMNVPCCTALFE